MRGYLSTVQNTMKLRFFMGVFLALGSIFGILHSAGAVHAETCTWDADQAIDIMSDAGNWTGCTLSADDNLVFDDTTTTEATWDNLLTEVADITFSTTTVVTMSTDVAATSTGNVVIEYGVLNMTNGAVLRVGGNLVASSTGSLVGDFSGSVNSTTVQMYGTNKTIGGTGTTTVSNFTIDGSIIVGSNVTTTKTLTIKSGKTLNAGGYIMNFTNTTTPFTVNGTFTASTSTVMFSGVGRSTIAGTTYYNLKSNSTGILGGNATTTNVMTIVAANSFNGGGYAMNLSGNGTPFVNAGTFTASTSTIEYSGANPNISSSTYYNVILGGSGIYAPLSDLTVGNNATVISGTLALTTSSIDITGALSNAGTITQGNTVTTTFSGGSATLSGSGATQFGKLYISGTLTMSGNATTTATTTIVGTLNAGGNILTLATTGTPFVIAGTFNANTSTIYYSSSGSVTTTVASYYDLVLGSGTYVLGGSSTSTNDFTNNGTFTMGSDTVLYVAADFDNNGTITENGSIHHTLTSVAFTDSEGTAITSFANTRQVIYVTFVDTDANLNASGIDTVTGTTITASNFSDTETNITLTETGNNTGIFIGSIPVSLSPSASSANGTLEISGSGTFTLAFAQPKDTNDTGSDSQEYVGDAFSQSGTSHGGGGGGGGGSPSANSKQPKTDQSTLINGSQQGLTLSDSQKHEVVVGATKHHVTRVSATDKSATIIIESSPVRVTIQKNELKKIDTNQDKRLDMSVRYLGFIAGQPKFIFTDLVVAKNVTKPTTPATPVTPVVPPVIRPVTSPITTPSVSPVVVKPITPATPVTLKFNKNLSLGATGTDVRALQEKLKALGYFTVQPNGVFGPMTKAAVMKFQKAKGINPVSGFVGPLTRNALNSL